MNLLISNNTEDVIITGDPFIVEKWNGKQWMKEKAQVNRIFNSIGYIIKPGENKMLEVDISGYYPNLKKGKYKISKSYFYQNDIPITKDKEHLIYQGFTIE
ncbi:immunoglobulin-like domain-containing protein [Kaistella polysaccharea]|uniref:immunoglobulin-like domain-containing protein n=1 Tax=Kaistella polysaccharea TaxID=2878534 RepID=UPI0028806306|nr:immunoglobulin-like domain-containing protein [Kaistella polysaccharea]